MVYLAGPGRANEHSSPHVVAGSPGVEAWYSAGELNRDSALALARHLDWPSRAHETRVVKGVYAHAGTGGRDDQGQRELARQPVLDASGKQVMADAHVYHVPLSLRAAEGQIGDELWREIAHEFMARMELTTDPTQAGDRPEDGAQDGSREDAPVRWAAVHHGNSKDSNDHIHLVVNLVREDGSKIDVHRDFQRAKTVCRELEEEFGLMPLHPNEYELARTYARANHERERVAEMSTPGADPRVPWLELSDEQQHQLMAAEVGTEAEWQRALRNREARPEPGTAEIPTTQGAREALGRARARAGYEQRLTEGSASTPWGKLPRAVRDDLANQAMPGEDPSTTLARMVRGCATASADEAEFVRRLRAVGRPASGRGRGTLLVKPRFARGRTDVVEGYSVALRPATRGERPIWRGGYRLGKDLSLTRLRAEWTRGTAEDPAAGVAAADAAIAEWTAAKTARPPVSPGREQWVPTAGDAEQAAADVRALAKRLPGVATTDRDTWARAHREAAGTFAAWSTSVEGPNPGPLAQAADALARGAETTRRDDAGPRRRPMPSIAGAAYLLAAAGGSGPAANLAVLKALMDLTTALAEGHAASREALRALRVEAVLREQLAKVAADLEPAAQVPVAAPAAPAGREAGSEPRSSSPAPTPTGSTPPSVTPPVRPVAPAAEPRRPSPKPDRGRGTGHER